MKINRTITPLELAELIANSEYPQIRFGNWKKHFSRVEIAYYRRRARYILSRLGRKK